MNNDPITPTPAPIPAIIPSVMPSPSPPCEYEWVFGFSGEECASFPINVKATAQTFAGRQMVALRTLGGLMVLVLYGDRRFELLMQEDGTLFGEKQYESYIPAELLETLTPPESLFRPAAWLAPVRLNTLPGDLAHISEELGRATSMVVAGKFTRRLDGSGNDGSRSAVGSEVICGNQGPQRVFHLIANIDAVFGEATQLSSSWLLNIPNDKVHFHLLTDFDECA